MTEAKVGGLGRSAGNSNRERTYFTEREQQVIAIMERIGDLPVRFKDLSLEIYGYSDKYTLSSLRVLLSRLRKKGVDIRSMGVGTSRVQFYRKDHPHIYVCVICGQSHEQPGS